MLKLRKLHSTGDTVVEVMISLAVLGSALSISYATANRALLTARNAQEHSEALEVLNSQLELLREAAANAADPNSDPFVSNNYCLGISGTSVVRIDFAPGYSRPADRAADTLAGASPATAFAPYPSECVSGLYYVSISYDDAVLPSGVSKDGFKLIVRWEAVNGTIRQEETLTYKIHKS